MMQLVSRAWRWRFDPYREELVRPPAQLDAFTATFKPATSRLRSVANSCQVPEACQRVTGACR
jgi:hypothetical protein